MSSCVCFQVEVSLQPWRAFKPDGVILFSDILTPLTGMGIPFDIEAGRGPIIHTPIRTMEVSVWEPKLLSTDLRRIACLLDELHYLAAWRADCLLPKPSCIFVHNPLPDNLRTKMLMQSSIILTCLNCLDWDSHKHQNSTSRYSEVLSKHRSVLSILI